jgi:hypothetical protein
MTSILPASSQQANKAALTAALAENPVTAVNGQPKDTDIEPGEIQEVDMQAQAEGIRTVFSDPTNFNVKVCLCLRSLRLQDLHLAMLAPALLTLDTLVRFSCNQGPQPSPNPRFLFSSDPRPSNSQCCCCARLDG